MSFEIKLKKMRDQLALIEETVLNDSENRDLIISGFLAQWQQQQEEFCQAVKEAPVPQFSAYSMQGYIQDERNQDLLLSRLIVQPLHNTESNYEISRQAKITNSYAFWEPMIPSSLGVLLKSAYWQQELMKKWKKNQEVKTDWNNPIKEPTHVTKTFQALSEYLAKGDLNATQLTILWREIQKSNSTELDQKRIEELNVGGLNLMLLKQWIELQEVVKGIDSMAPKMLKHYQTLEKGLEPMTHWFESLSESSKCALKAWLKKDVEPCFVNNHEGISDTTLQFREFFNLTVRGFYEWTGNKERFYGDEVVLLDPHFLSLMKLDRATPIKNPASVSSSIFNFAPESVCNEWLDRCLEKNEYPEELFKRMSLETVWQEHLKRGEDQNSQQRERALLLCALKHYKRLPCSVEHFEKVLALMKHRELEQWIEKAIPILPERQYANPIKKNSKEVCEVMFKQYVRAVLTQPKDQWSNPNKTIVSVLLNAIVRDKPVEQIEVVEHEVLQHRLAYYKRLLLRAWERKEVAQSGVDEDYELNNRFNCWIDSDIGAPGSNVEMSRSQRLDSVTLNRFEKLFNPIDGLVKKMGHSIGMDASKACQEYESGTEENFHFTKLLVNVYQKMFPTQSLEALLRGEVEAQPEKPKVQGLYRTRLHETTAESTAKAAPIKMRP